MEMSAPTPLLDRSLLDAVQALRPAVMRGKVVQAFGTTLRVSGLKAEIGQQCLIRDRRAPERSLRAEVVGLAGEQLILVPLGHMHGLSSDAEVELAEQASWIPGGPGLGISVNEEYVAERASVGHRWRNPIWRHADGSVAEW